MGRKKKKKVKITRWQEGRVQMTGARSCFSKQPDYGRDTCCCHRLLAHTITAVTFWKPTKKQTPNDSLRNQRHTKAVAEDTSVPSKRIIYLEAKSKTSRKYLIFFSYMRPARDIAAFCHDWALLYTHSYLFLLLKALLLSYYLSVRVLWITF